jgi:flagellar protein FliO/FliZ
MTGLLTAFGALLGVLALIAAIAALIRRGGLARVFGGFAPPNAPDRRLSLRETVALDSRRRLHLVQCGDRQVVVLTGGAQDLVVGWINHA